MFLCPRSATALNWHGPRAPPPRRPAALRLYGLPRALSGSSSGAGSASASYDPSNYREARLARTRLRTLRTSQLQAHLSKALSNSDYMTAYDVFMDMSELGATHSFFDGARVVKLLARFGHVREMLAVYETMRYHGFCCECCEAA